MMGVLIAIVRAPTIITNKIHERIDNRLKKYLMTGVFAYILTQYLLIIRIYINPVVTPQNVALLDSFILMFLFYGLSLFLIPTTLLYFIFKENITPID